MPTDSKTLIDNARCISETIPPGLMLPVLIALVAQVSDVPLDPQALIDSAKCLDCQVPRGLMLPILVALADT